MGRKKAVTIAVNNLNRSVRRTASIWNGKDSGRASGRTLGTILEMDGAKATDIAKALNLRPSTMSEKLQKLEEDGNIIRKRDRNDLRVVRVFVTDKGKQLVENNRTVGKKNSPDYTDVLTDEEYNQFIKLSKKLTDELDRIYFEEKKKRLEIRRLELELDEFYESDEDVG